MGKPRHGVPVTRRRGKANADLAGLGAQGRASVRTSSIAVRPHTGWEDPSGVGISEEWPLQPLPQNLSEALGFHLGGSNCQPLIVTAPGSLGRPCLSFQPLAVLRVSMS